MAVHKRVRKAGRKLLAHVRRGRQALQGRRASTGDDGDAEALALDQRLHALATAIRAGQYYEGPWQTFCFGQFKGLDDEQALKQLAAWARRHQITIGFEERKARGVDVLYLVLRCQ